MPINVTDIASAIVDSLSNPDNAGEFSEEFTAERVYSLDTNWVNYTDAPRVFVISRKEENQPEDREDDRFEFSVGIAVIRKVTNTDPDTIDPLLDLPRSIRDFLNKRDMAGANSNNCTIEVLFLADELNEDSCLVSALGSEYWTEQ
ncbi:hypothetical protein [Gimesia sp.]|uniref:hypothetical protein n=1 Tax=Gimesia sp. TaxID=2024833 RepID=UPI003A92AA0A